MERLSTTSMYLTLAFVIVLGLVFIFTCGKEQTYEQCYSIQSIGGKLMLIGILPIIVGLYFRYMYKKMDDFIFKIERLPLLDANEATEGVPFSGEGIIKANAPLKSPKTETPCVYYHYILEEYKKSGKSHKWVIEKNNAEWRNFSLRDRRGNDVVINLKGVDKDLSGYPLPNKLFKNESQMYSEIDGVYKLHHQEFSVPGIIPFTSKRFRETEFVFPVESNAYVVGMIDKDEKGLLFLREDKDWPLIISLKTKDAYLNDFKQGEDIFVLSHFSIAFGYSLLTIGLTLTNIINQFIFWPAFIIGNSIIIGTAVFTLYNRIIELDERCNNALSTVDIELKRRAELIPNLVNAVKGYKEYENLTQTMLNEIRIRPVLSTGQSKNITKVSSLIANIEKYPELKASEQFQKLMTELTDTEERIAQTREFYNKTVLYYNNMIMRFPTSILSNFMKKDQKNFLNFETM